MSSYVAVQGTPRKDSSYVFGLTPKEVRYLRVTTMVSYELYNCIVNKRLFPNIVRQNYTNSWDQTGQHKAAL